MRSVHQRYCGLDVHKKTVVACVITLKKQETRTFGTMTRDLLASSDWLLAERVTQRGDGVDLASIYNLLVRSPRLAGSWSRGSESDPTRAPAA